MPSIAFDATYSLDERPSGVAVYSLAILDAIARAHPDSEFLCCYRPHRFAAALKQQLPCNCRRRLLQEPFVPRSAALFHGLNQRLPHARLRAAVSTFHDLFVLTGEFSTPEFRRRFERQARDAAGRSDLIVAVSEFTASQVEGLLGFDRRRIRVVPHGVRLAPQGPPPDAGERERIVLHVGAIQKRKNVARLVRAFAAMPAGWRLLLAGSLGYGAGEIAAEIGRSPCRREIEVLGYVNDDFLSDLYRRAAILAFPSCGEGFGIPILEAMAWGVAVITSDGSALREVAGDAAVLVDPGSQDQIAAALAELAGSLDLRRVLVEKGRRRAASFTWEAAAEKTWAAYRELL